MDREFFWILYGNGHSSTYLSWHKSLLLLWPSEPSCFLSRSSQLCGHYTYLIKVYWVFTHFWIYQSNYLFWIQGSPVAYGLWPFKTLLSCSCNPRWKCRSVLTVSDMTLDKGRKLFRQDLAMLSYTKALLLPRGSSQWGWWTDESLSQRSYLLWVTPDGVIVQQDFSADPQQWSVLRRFHHIYLPRHRRGRGNRIGPVCVCVYVCVCVCL